MMKVRNEDVTNLCSEVQDDDDAFRLDVELPFIDDEDNDSSDELHVSVGTVSENAQDDNSDDLQLQEDIGIFIAGIESYFSSQKKKFGKNRDHKYRYTLNQWNKFQGRPFSSGIISSDYHNRIKDYVSRCKTMDDKEIMTATKDWIRRTLIAWFMFVQAQQGISPVTKYDALLTTATLLFYVLDMVSDIGTVFIYGFNGNWVACILTLVPLYIGIYVVTYNKWVYERLYFNTPFDKLRYIVSSLFVNWPVLKEFWCYFRLEWKLCRSPKSNAHLVSQWYERRRYVFFLKFTEGQWEACPQVILQFCLLFSELGHITWTVYLRIASTIVSLCTAGATLVNQEKLIRLDKCNELPVSEFIVLLLWAVPVTVSRLLSMSLLLTTNLFVGLTFLTLYMVMYIIFLWFNFSVIVKHVSYVSRTTLLVTISPFIITNSWLFFLVSHGIHFFCNFIMTMIWIFTTSLACTHPLLYIAIITFSSVLFPIGILGWFIHKKCWHREYYWKLSSVANL